MEFETSDNQQKAQGAAAMVAGMLKKKIEHFMKMTNLSEPKADAALGYFKGLNYTLANEDTGFELALADHYKPQNILTVCGSGGRSLPFLALPIKKLTLVDLSAIQIDLAELKYETLCQLSFEDYLLFWGFPPFLPEENRDYRMSLFESLKLSSSLKGRFVELFKIHKSEGLLYKGQWEKRYTIVPKILRQLLNPRITKHYDTLFSFKDLKDQQAFVENALENPFWKALPKAVVFAFGNARYFNAMIYRGAMMTQNIEGSSYDFYLAAFRRILTQTLARENFFLQLSFFGRLIYPEANTPEAQKHIFEAAKSQVGNVDTAFLKTPIIPGHLDPDHDAQALQQRGPYDFVSLSDVPSYFKGPLEATYLQDLKPLLKPGAIVVTRCYLRIPEGTREDDFEDISNMWEERMALEKTQMYKIYVYQYHPKAK